MIRRRVTAQYALDTPVRWAADPHHRYVIARWRYVESPTGTWNEYLLAQPGRGLVCWVHEADLLVDDPLAEKPREKEEPWALPGATS